MRFYNFEYNIPLEYQRIKSPYFFLSVEVLEGLEDTPLIKTSPKMAANITDWEAVNKDITELAKLYFKTTENQAA